MVEVRRFADLDALSRAAADDFIALGKAAIAARGVFHVLLSGGSTPKRLFSLLADRGPTALAWDKVELWWGDERSVAPTDADSNYRMTREALIEPLQLDERRVHRIAGELEPTKAAADYQRALVAALGQPPVSDLALQGMGPDGHTASLFPHSPALDDTTHWVVANPVDSPVAKGKTTRITLTARAINATRAVRFLVAGGDKAPALHAVLEGPRDGKAFPAQLIDNATWLVDEAAASKLGTTR